MSAVPAVDPHGFRRILYRNIALPLIVGVISVMGFVALIAYLLSDGCAQSQISVTNAIPEVAADLEEVARKFGMSLRVYNKPNTAASQFRFVQQPSVRVQARQKVSTALKRAASSGP